MTPDEIDAEMARRIAVWLDGKARATARVFDMAGNPADQPTTRTPIVRDRARQFARLRQAPRRPAVAPVPAPELPSPWVSIRAAARFVGVTPRAIYNWIEEGTVPYRRLPNGRMRVNKDALLKVPACCDASAASR